MEEDAFTTSRSRSNCKMSFVDKSLDARNEVRRFFLGWLNPHKLALEKARIDLNVELKEHWKPRTIDVYELILENWDKETKDDAAGVSERDNDFIVFIDQELGVDWINNSTLSPESAKCVSYAESIGAKRCEHLPQDQVLEFKRLVGQAIVSGLRGESKQSSRLADNAADFLKDRTVERSRSWTLTSAHIFVLIFSLALALLNDAFAGSSLMQAADRQLLWLAIQGGVVGAYLSVVQKAGRGEWDAAAGRLLHHIEVFTKLFAGGLLGLIAFALSRSVHAPSSLKAIVTDGYSALLLGVTAGLFERQIPKMISTYAKPDKADRDTKP